MRYRYALFLLFAAMGIRGLLIAQQGVRRLTRIDTRNKMDPGDAWEWSGDPRCPER